jgi:hypothetical protein
MSLIKYLLLLMDYLNILINLIKLLNSDYLPTWGFICNRDIREKGVGIVHNPKVKNKTIAPFR